METICIYLDIFFCFNLILNLLVLSLTGFASGQKPRLWRLITASAVGSGYACLTVFPNMIFFTGLPVRLLVSAGMVFWALRPRKLREFLKIFSLYYLLNFMLAGGITFSGNFFPAPLQTTILTVLSGILVLLLGGEFYCHSLKKSVLQKEKRILLTHEGKHLELRAFPDTGNTLTEPLEHLGVIVVKSEKLTAFFPEKESETVKNFRLIPCSTVTDEYSILYGFRPDSLLCEGKQIRAVVAASDTLEADGYDAIINPIILL